MPSIASFRAGSCHDFSVRRRLVKNWFVSLVYLCVHYFSVISYLGWPHTLRILVARVGAPARSLLIFLSTLSNVLFSILCMRIIFRLTILQYMGETEEGSVYWIAILNIMVCIYGTYHSLSFALIRNFCVIFIPYGDSVSLLSLLCLWCQKVMI